MFFIIYDCFINLYQGFLFTWFIRKMLTRKRYEPVAFWCCSIMTAISLSSYLFFPMPALDIWIFIFIFIYAVLFFKDEILQKVFWIIILLIVSEGTVSTAFHIITTVFKTTTDTLISDPVFRIVFSITVNAIISLIFVLIVILCKNEKTQPLHISALLAVNILCASLLDIFFVLSNNYYLYDKWLFIGCRLTLLVGGLAIYFYYIFNDYSALKYNYKIQEKMLENSNAQIVELQTLYSRMLKLQHDMNAYLKDLKELSDTNPAKYLKLLEEQFHPIPSTGNPVLDSVLSIKYYKMGEHQIEFRGANLHYTGGMNILDVTLCSLISNMLDNAIEALIANKENISEPYVYLGFSYSALGLMIICENPIVNNNIRHESFFSRKKESGHGLGISIMKKIVNDAKGQIDFINNDNLFRVLALIPSFEKMKGDV